MKKFYAVKKAQADQTAASKIFSAVENEGDGSGDYASKVSR